MKALTYRDLLKQIARMSSEELDAHVSILHPEYSDEFLELETIGHVTETDVLDAGHPVLVTKGNQLK